MPEIKLSTCRSCPAACPVSVTLENGVVKKVEGNPEAPLYKGFICPKGRALEAAHNDADRLMHHLKRMPDGSYQRVSSEDLVGDIAEKLKTILDEHGPGSVAASFGNAGLENWVAVNLMIGFLASIGSDRFYSNVTIDQPGLSMASAMHGTWAGGYMDPEDCDVYLIAGGNPIISKQYLSPNPGQTLKRMIKKGCRLIVIDPRKSETARKADVHLQIMPGEDTTVFAGLLHLVIKNGAVDEAFVAKNASGFSQLADAVQDYTPEYVAKRAGISESGLRRAAQLLGDARTGDCVSGVGSHMSTRGTLNTYLLFCLKTLRGFYPRAGEEARHTAVLNRARSFRAQPRSPWPAWGFGGRKTGVRGLEMSAAGMPLSALPEEMLREGQDQVKAYFTLGNGMTNWPQTELVKRAFESLDLLVVHDVEHSAIARIATHVIATKKQFEIPTSTQYMEMAGALHSGYGWSEPYAAYNPAILEPPADAELMDSWQIYYRVAQKLGLTLGAPSMFDVDPSKGPKLDMQNEPTTDELLELLAENSVVPLAEVKQHPDGNLFDQARATIKPRDANCEAFFQVADPYIIEQLRLVRHESIDARRGLNDEFPFSLISVRIQNTTCAGYRPRGLLRQTYNPLSMHPENLAALGIEEGDLVNIRSRHGSIVGVAGVDKNLRLGTVSMCHGFGKIPGEDTDPRVDGTNVNLLLSWDDDYDPHHGQPRMSALPVCVTKLSESDSICESNVTA